MTQADELPPEVALLLRDHIESYEQLELLLLLRAEPDRSWTEEALGARLCLPVSLITEALARLQSAGLANVSETGAKKEHQYRLQDERIEATVSELARAYRDHPMPLIRLMTANAIERVRSSALRAFADAFFLRKDKDGR